MSPHYSHCNHVLLLLLLLLFSLLGGVASNVSIHLMDRVLEAADAAKSAEAADVVVMPHVAVQYICLSGIPYPVHLLDGVVKVAGTAADAAVPLKMTWRVRLLDG